MHLLPSIFSIQIPKEANTPSKVPFFLNKHCSSWYTDIQSNRFIGSWEEEL